MPVKAIPIPLDPRHARLTRAPAAPGEFRFEDMQYHASAPPAPGETGRLNFYCPRGHGVCGAIIIGNGFKPSGPKTWQWDGNAESPTLTPSINCLTGKTGNPNFPEEEYAGCGWHAYLQNGEFTGE